MQPTPPFWFRQRQGKMENVDDHTLRLTAPNQGDAFIGVRPGADGRWAGVLLQSAAGPEVERTPAAFATPQEAWEAAFELHRRHNVV
jgi:hypothetical protein